MQDIKIIGAGFSGLSAAMILAKHGLPVEIYEKNSTVGGRARQFTSEGFTFDMGPSWYWMPDVFDHLFEKVGFQTSDFYQLEKLDPSFTMVFNNQEALSIPANYKELRELFEKIESGAAKKLDAFMQSAEEKYNTGMKKLVYKPALSWREFVDIDILSGIFRLQLFSGYGRYVRRFFSDPRLISLMEFPVLFLGAMPSKTPALYSLMNYAGLKQGNFYPMGGFGKVIDAFVQIAKQLGVKISTNSDVEGIVTKGNHVAGLRINGEVYDADVVLGSADYQHVESLLPSEYRHYSPAYWSKKIFAPSCLIYYLGVGKKIKNLTHHTLFFDANLEFHANEIYKDKKWPENPLFYVCAPSKTDTSVAPPGMENLFLLMPIAPGLEDSASIREYYFEKMMERLESFTGQRIRDDLVVKKSYCVSDFVNDYNAYKGNAYGLANTLNQTAFLKPKIRSKKLNNLYFAGQLTVPGPGVPPSLISGQIAAKLILERFNK